MNKKQRSIKIIISAHFRSQFPKLWVIIPSGITQLSVGVMKNLAMVKVSDQTISEWKVEIKSLGKRQISGLFVFFKIDLFIYSLILCGSVFYLYVCLCESVGSFTDTNTHVALHSHRNTNIEANKYINRSYKIYF